MKSHFGEGGKDAAADVDVDMAAVFWDSSVGLCTVCVFTLCGILTKNGMKKKKQCLPLTLPQLLNLIKDQ